MIAAAPNPLSPEEQYGEIQLRAKNALKLKIYLALQEATTQTKQEMVAAGLELQPPALEFFAAGIHQSLYCTLCGADPETFQGGNPATAIAVIRNARSIAVHYWNADIK